MKKICSLILVIYSLLIFSAIAFAKPEKNGEIEENYNFSNVQRIFIINTDLPDKKIFDRYFKKMKCEFISKDDARKILGYEENDVDLKTQDIAQISDVFIETEILEKVYEFHHRVPEKITYSGWVNEEEYDSKTKKYKKKRRYKESDNYFWGATKHVRPAYDVYKSSIKMQFKICESSSGKILMNYFVERSKLDTLNLIESLYKDSWKYFFKDLRVLIKNKKKFMSKNKNFKYIQDELQ